MNGKIVFVLLMTLLILVSATVLSWDMVGFDISDLSRSRLIICLAAVKIVLIASEFMGLRHAHWAFLSIVILWSATMAMSLSYLLLTAETPMQ